jgi:hypothetical protein
VRRDNRGWWGHVTGASQVNAQRDAT